MLSSFSFFARFSFYVMKTIELFRKELNYENNTTGINK